MKSKIETTALHQQEIDWGKVMLVESDGVIMLTTGRHNGDLFIGTVIASTEFNIGCQISTCIKAQFQPLPLPQTITFYE